MPVKAREKKPLLRNWQSTAPNEQSQVEEIFKQFWTCNIGIVTGEASGLLVIDVDAPKKAGEVSGADSLALLEQEIGALPDTLTQITGGGGKQFFFRYPHGRTIRNSVGKLPVVTCHSSFIYP